MGGKTTKEEPTKLNSNDGGVFSEKDYPPNCSDINGSSEKDYNFDVTNELSSNIHTYKNYDFLPTNNLHLIFMYSKPNELLNSMSTCRLFYQVINTNFFWKSYVSPNETNEEEPKVTNWKKKYFLFSNSYLNFDKSNEFFKQKFKYGQKMIDPGIDFPILIKLFCFGETGVGKSSIIDRFHSGQYIDDRKGTKGLDFKTTNTVVKDKDVKLQLWDSSNSISIRTKIYRNANGILLIFSFDNKESFVSLTKWMEEIEVYGRQLCSVVIVGHKSDLKNKADWFNDNMISEMFEEYNQKFNERVKNQYPDENSLLSNFKMQYCECSSKENTNIFLPFGLLLTQTFNREYQSRMY